MTKKELDIIANEYCVKKFGAETGNMSTRNAFIDGYNLALNTLLGCVIYRIDGNRCFRAPNKGIMGHYITREGAEKLISEFTEKMMEIYIDRDAYSRGKIIDLAKQAFADVINKNCNLQNVTNCPICGGSDCAEGMCFHPFDADGNPL